jgi:oligoribonuclease (3'-5' exoribonuclease)
VHEKRTHVEIYREKLHKMKNLQLYEYYGPRGEYADPQERIELLEEAQAKLGEAIGLIEEALKGSSHQRHAETYILSHLNNWVDSGNRFDMGIQQYIDKLKEEQEKRQKGENK